MMKKTPFLLFLIFINTSVFGHNNENIKFDTNIFLYKDSIPNNISFEQTINQINKFCTNDTQKLCLVAGWIYNNIDFDLDKFSTGGTIGDFQKVFKLRKGICGDYSALFAAFCNKLNIKNEIIEGYVPEFDSDNKIYHETNHAWNIVKLGSKWYHCDLLGFSGFLKKKKEGGFEFVKKPKPNDFLAQNLVFISSHIPADPIWQLSNYPIPLDTFLKYGEQSKIDSTVNFINFEKRIAEYVELPANKKPLIFADHAYNYNHNNSNIIVVNYYNASVRLINNWKKDKKKLILAKEYLEKAKKYVVNATNGVEILKNEIENSIEIINKHLH